MSEFCRVFSKELGNRLPTLEVVQNNNFVPEGGVSVKFPDNNKQSVAHTYSHDPSNLHVQFKKLNRPPLDVITSITSWGKQAWEGQLRLIGQNGVVEMVPILLWQYDKEPTLISGEMYIRSTDIAELVARFLADATGLSPFKGAHLFMLGKTALPVPTRNMWVRRVRARGSASDV